MTRRILLTLESRATYGYSKNVYRAIQQLGQMEVVTLVTGMHLIPELGNSVDYIRADGLPISATVPMTPGPGRAGWSEALGAAIAGYSGAYEKLQPDIVLISGDRIEAFGCCIAAAYMGIPVAHIQAGDKSGHIDDAARMAMAKLAHIHLASCGDSAERLVRLGEEDFRIFNVGAPQLDDIVDRDFSPRTTQLAGRSFDLHDRYLLLVQHPLMVERDEVARQLRDSVEACLATGMPLVWIYPNTDLGYRDVLDVVAAYRDNPQIWAIPNLDRDDYLTLLANAAALIGNSSSGVLEAPSFKVPVINIGDRQRGRPQASNIVNCAVTRSDIDRALDTVLRDKEFLARCANAVNPYGDGRSGARIASLLQSIVLDKRLMDKKTVY